MSEIDEMEHRVLDALDNAYARSPDPPPFLDATNDERAPTGIEPDQLDASRRNLQTQLTDGFTLGMLLRRRREAMTVQIDSLAQLARWSSERVERLEADKLDLSVVEPLALARLLRALAIDSVSPVDAPLRALAKDHLAVYESREGPLFGRTRRDVSLVDRRRDLASGVMLTDHEATARAADLYIRAVQEYLCDSSSNKS